MQLPEKNEKAAANKTISLQKYYDLLIKNGTSCAKGEDSLWIKHEKFSALRFPEFETKNISKKEISEIFKQLKCPVINYTAISAENSENTYYLYICRDTEYSIDKLESSSVRRNIRYAQRHLKYGFADWDEILNKGLKAYADTRTRVGLSDGNQKTFNERFQSFSLNPAHKTISAGFDDQLVAFLSLIEVEDFVIIQGTFSTDEHRSLKPNNLLIDFVLNHYLTLNKFSVVCYGLSSVQENTNKDSLHAYKVQVGFDAVPVQRVFILHPYVKSLEPLLRTGLKFLLLILPKNRYVRKAYGLLNVKSATT